MNHLRTLLICLALLAASSLDSFAQKYNKYADSYNFRKGMEALDERDSKKAEDSFRKEIDEHPENGYAYLYLAHIQQHNEEYGKALSSVDNALKYIPKKDKEYKGACHYNNSSLIL